MGSGKEHWDKVAALEAMGRDGDKARVPELVEVLEDERECWHTRTAAIRSLVALEAGEAGPAILKLLAKDDDVDTLEAAIDALGQLRFERATRMLERLEADGEEPLLQAAAKRALGIIRRNPYR